MKTRPLTKSTVNGRKYIQNPRRLPQIRQLLPKRGHLTGILPLPNEVLGSIGVGLNDLIPKDTLTDSCVV